MKNNKLKKIILALALASVALAPSIKEAYATETTTSEKNYLEIYQEFKNTIKEAQEIKQNYKYKNADFYYQRGLDQDLKDAEALEEKVSKSAPSDEAKINMATSTGNLKFAIKALNGQKASSKELDELLAEYEKFMKSDAFEHATLKQKTAYMDAYDKAKNYKILYGRDENTLEKVKLDAHTKAIKDAKAAIVDAYAPAENKSVLKKEIALAAVLRDKKDKYTEKSFETFLSALRLAETSVEDKSTMKTAKEYKDIADTLRNARLALVEKEDENTKELIRSLEEAVEQNEVTVRAVNLLFELSPKKVEGVKDKLLAELEESKQLQKEAREMIAYLKGIKG